MKAKEIQAVLEKNSIPFRKELPELLQIYLEMLKDWNARMDLTAVADDEEIVDRHFADSLTVLKTGLIPKDAALIDVGTGAGFPGLVLAMACPDLRVSLLDGQQKRLSFLKAVCEETALTNTVLIHTRAEDGGRRKDLRERFDVSTARALAPVNTLCEYLLPFVRVGGIALCWKGPALKEELASGRRAAHLLGGRLEQPVSCPVAGRDWEHLILPVRKTEHTSSQYPRKAGTPKGKPLGTA